MTVSRSTLMDYSALVVVILLLPPRGEVAMKAFETFAIYVTPFLILGAAVKVLLRRYAVDLTDVQDQAGPKRRLRRVFLLGGWRTED